MLNKDSEFVMHNKTRTDSSSSSTAFQHGPASDMGAVVWVKVVVFRRSSMVFPIALLAALLREAAAAFLLA